MDVFARLGLILAFAILGWDRVQSEKHRFLSFRLSVLMLVWIMMEDPCVADTLRVLSVKSLGPCGLTLYMISMFAFALFVWGET